ncbi:MAG TPA: hypothetical protein VGX97_02495 [bacterium]|nr:hypothetical protein [bacterium]
MLTIIYYGAPLALLSAGFVGFLRIATARRANIARLSARLMKPRGLSGRAS